MNATERNERAAKYIALKQYQRRMERRDWIEIGFMFAFSVFVTVGWLLTSA